VGAKSDIDNERPTLFQSLRVKEVHGSAAPGGKRHRFITGIFAITAVVIVASTLLTYYFGNRVMEARSGQEQRRLIIADLDQIITTLEDAETGQRGFIIAGDENYLAPYNDASGRIADLVRRIQAMTSVGISQGDVATLTNLIEQKMAELRRTIDLRKNEGFEAAAAVMRTGEGRRIMDKLRAAVGRLKDIQSKQAEEDARQTDAATRTRTLVFILTGSLNIVFLIWAYQRIADSLRQRDAALGEAEERGRELQEKKDLLSVTLGSIGDCVIVMDEKGRIDFMNAVAEQVTGWSFAEGRGRPASEIFRILNEHTREPVENPVDKVLKQGVVIGLANHTLLIRKDGSEIPIDDSGAPIRNAEGQMCGVVLVFRDFSEHRKSERDLRAAKEQAEAANKAKDQFLAMLSHELRTPLTPVLATLNIWESSEDVPKSLQGDVQMLRRSIELEARIIDDLLDLTRIARGMLSFSPENTDLHALIEFLIGLSQSEVQEKRLNVSLQLDAERHHIHTDAARLQQVLWNILRNAIKFTDNKGDITVTTSNDDEGRVQVAISDSGIGMTRETISRLFMPFEQADSARSSRYGGLGLGMAISSALVELLDGHLTAKSGGLGRGSTFTVTFATTDAVESGGAQESTRPPTPGKARLLLIEDHVDTARALSRLLESRGYEVRAEESVATGLKAVGEEKFDVFLCDLGLPDGTGFDFVMQARRTHDTPAIALTGFGMQQDVERAHEAGFVAHLTKPVNLQKLESTIWMLLQGRQ
jgi:PAS domain S-box-containing protein